MGRKNQQNTGIVICLRSVTFHELVIFTGSTIFSLAYKDKFQNVAGTSIKKPTANRRRRQDFPTPESPIRSSLNK